MDQDVYRDTIRFLSEPGHDLVLAADLGMSRAPDEQLLQTAVAQDRIFVTRDKDFGNLVFVHRMTVTAQGHRLRRLPSA